MGRKITKPSGGDAAKRIRMKRSIIQGTAFLVFGLALLGAAAWLLASGNVAFSLFAGVLGLFIVIGETVELGDLKSEYRALFGNSIWRKGNV